MNAPTLEAISAYSMAVVPDSSVRKHLISRTVTDKCLPFGVIASPDCSSVADEPDQGTIERLQEAKFIPTVLIIWPEDGSVCGLADSSASRNVQAGSIAHSHAVATREAARRSSIAVLIWTDLHLRSTWLTHLRYAASFGGYLMSWTIIPPHCLSPIAAQLATDWSKSSVTLPFVTKLFITNFEHLALLLEVLPSVTTLEFPR